MKKQDLDALRELYSSVYGGEFLLERRQALPGQSQIEIDRQEAERARQAQATNRALQSRRTIDARLSSGLGATLTGQRGRVALNKKGELEVKDANPNFQLDKTIQFGGKGYNRKTGPDGKVTYVPASNPLRPAAPPTTPAGSPPPTTPAGSPPPRTPAGSPPPRTPAGSPPPAAKPSGVVLARKNNVTGTLDKSTGKFTEKNWNDAETQRYQARAAQNAARTSASSGGSPSSSSSSSTSATSAPKTPTPAIGKLGNTSFERRTPTSAELKAAQGARDKGASPEKALQAAQRTNLPTTGPTSAIPDLNSVSRDLTRANTVANLNRAPAGSAAAKELAAKPATSAPTPAQIAGASQGITPATSGTNSINNNDKKNKSVEKQSYEWPSAKTIRDIADAYASIYEAKKKDQDGDKDKDFADVMIARMMASGMSRAEAIAAVRNKEYNEEYELDEATRMRKELGKEGETRVRGELAARSRAYKRSGSVDKTIAAAERAADRTTPRGRNESPGDYKARMQKRSQTLNKLAANRRKSVRSGEGLRGYAAKVEGSDRDLQSARGSARSAGTLTPKEKKQLGEEYQIYEIVASYLLENNFAETLNDANVIIENMSEVWLEEILNNN